MSRPARKQEPFSVQAKIALVRRGMTITDLARALGKSRTAVSQAIHLGIHRPTRVAIAEFLSIAA